MNVLHARELARRLAGTGVTTYALHPGGVASNIWRSLPQPIQWLLKLFLDSNEEGARTPLYCATAPELVLAGARRQWRLPVSGHDAATFVGLAPGEYHLQLLVDGRAAAEKTLRFRGPVRASLQLSHRE
jgi:NAD(P)-dependent dehydrogenase (short-subunit alcohol dehydrogenase family)